MTICLWSGQLLLISMRPDHKNRYFFVIIHTGMVPGTFSCCRQILWENSRHAASVLVLDMRTSTFVSKKALTKSICLWLLRHHRPQQLDHLPYILGPCSQLSSQLAQSYLSSCSFALSYTPPSTVFSKVLYFSYMDILFIHGHKNNRIEYNQRMQYLYRFALAICSGRSDHPPSSTDTSMNWL